ncbi:MAG TPA: NADH-quinone oxidoreductase subunit K [Anaerolineaceae bacterium]|jgi:NADH:ubiquinone oxidoreductase subunit K|nr:NADH-quinone oxidoreductase subunit K [Anaerolineaceae bacterium]
MNLSLFHYLSAALFFLGWVCLLTQRNAFKQVIGLKILLQGVTLALLLAGKDVGDVNLAQVMVISALIVETMVIALALAMIVSVFHIVPSGDIDLLRKLKG